MGERVGLIGLGNMGLPMANHLIAAGYEVIGFRRGNTAEFEAMGGHSAKSPKDIVDHTKIVLSCLPNDSSLEDVVSGESGILAGECSNLVLIELSTLSERVASAQAAAVAAKGGVMLDGAISGLPPMLSARKATFLIAGEASVFERVKPVLQVMTENLHYMGAFGCAMRTKLCANLLVASHIAAAAEALVFGTKLGIDPLKLLDVLTISAGSSLQLQARGKRMVTGDWHQVLGSTQLLMKDVNLIEVTANEIDCPVPVLNSASHVYQKAIEEGFGETDVASVYAAFASAAGLAIPVHGSGDMNA